MNLELDAKDQSFRLEVQTFIDKHWPSSMRKIGDGRSRFAPRNESVSRWFEALVDNGWSVPNWPEVHGGTGWTPTQKYIWNRETTAANCPQMSPFGARMLAPVLYTWGTKEQQERFLPPIREAKVYWCQGYSEPGAGSDLARLGTKAVRDGDDYLVNGAKTWTTGAHTANWMFCLVRTDPDADKPQSGISFLLIDMRSKGITVDSITTLGGFHSVNTVTLENVRVPVHQRVGEENKGWTYAKGLLTHERTGIANVGQSQIALRRLRQLATQTSADEETLAQDAAFQKKINEIEVELMALEMTELRVLAQVEQGGAPGPESSILKVRGTEISQRISELFLEMHGYYSIPYPEEYLLGNEGPIGPEHAVSDTSAFLMGRASSIFGGSNEIQKNIISKHVLGL